MTEAGCALLPNADNETCLTQGSGYDRACDACRIDGWPDLRPNLDAALRAMVAKTASDWERLSLDAIDMVHRHDPTNPWCFLSERPVTDDTTATEGEA